MKSLNVIALVLVTMIASGPVVASGLAPHAAAMKIGTANDVELAKQAINNLHARLMAQQVEIGVNNSIVVELSSELRASLSNSSSDWPLQVGVVAPVNSKISVDGTSSARPYGAFARAGGNMVWSTSVVSRRATGIRLYITGLDLPKGVELAIYNERGEAFAYTGKGPLGTGEFWTNAVTGDTAFLQISGADINDVKFEIADLGYLGDKWVVGAHANLEKSFCSYNASCVDNAGCGTDSAAVDATNGVAHMQYVQRPYMYVCSGGLLANEAGKPYFLTANHCISRDNVAQTLESYFFYKIGCNEKCPVQWSQPTTPRVLGASIVKTSSTSDYSLLELGGPAPAGSVLMGWDATDIAFANGTSLYRISHPSAAPQAYSTHTVDTSYGTCTSWPRGNWIYSRDTNGATEGGSSGSPVVNSNGDVVGQLSGGCGININETCDWQSNATVDGAFAAYYDDIASYLGGGGGCSDDIDGDGYIAASCGGNDCNDNVWAINPGAAEICGDLTDNNCDGTIDEGCGAPTCDPKGAPCSLANAGLCCSGRCNPKKLTCS